MNRARPSAGQFVIASALFLACGDPAPDVEEENGLVATNDSVYAQTVEERDYAREAVPAEWAVDPHPELFNPGYVEADDDWIYVFDYGSMQLQLFAWNGEFIRLIGEGRGEGPGEIHHLSNLLVLDDRIWLVDGNGRRAVSYDRDGTFRNQFDLEDGAGRMAPLGENFIVQVTVGEPGGMESLLRVIDTTGEKQHEFGAIMEAYDLESPMSVASWLASTSEQVIRAPTFGSYLFYYDTEGEHVRTVRTIDRMEFTESELEQLNEDTWAFPRPETPVEYATPNVFNDTLAMHARKEEQSVVDYYAAETGAYLHSVELPERVQTAHAHRDYIVTLGDTTLTKYRVE